MQIELQQSVEHKWKICYNIRASGGGYIYEHL